MFRRHEVFLVSGNQFLQVLLSLVPLSGEVLRIKPRRSYLVDESNKLSLLGLDLSAYRRLLLVEGISATNQIIDLPLQVFRGHVSSSPWLPTEANVLYTDSVGYSNL